MSGTSLEDRIRLDLVEVSSSILLNSRDPTLCLQPRTRLSI